MKDTHTEEGEMKVWGSEGFVYLSIEGNEYRIKPNLAREVGDGMYKLGCIEGDKSND